MPWKGLMGKKGEWGLEIQRNLPGNIEGNLVGYNPHEDWLKVSRFTIMKDINFRGTKLVTEIQPILVITHGEDFIDSVSYKPELGGNLYLRMRENFKLAITYNPDFAEIESDPFQLNFSKYALFYAEKRPFFNEGKEFFSPSGWQPLNIFYSRQIGKTLVSGKVIPIQFAEKGFLKTKVIEISTLHAKTKETIDVIEDTIKVSATDFWVNKIKLFPTEPFSISLMSAYRFPYLEQGKGLLAAQIYYNDEATTLSIDQVFDNYTSKDYATKIYFSKQLKEIGLEQTITSIPDEFSDQEIGYIPWNGLREINSGISYNHFLNRYGMYSIYSQCIFSYKRELDEPYVWDTNVLTNFNFKNNMLLTLGTSYGKEFELDTLFTTSSYNVSVLTNRAKSFSMWLNSTAFKTYNYRQNYIGWVVSNELSPLINTEKTSLYISILQWLELDPNHNLLAVTYSLRPYISIDLFKRCDLNFYMNLPIENSKITSQRIGCYLTWNPSGKNYISTAYNNYRTYDENKNKWISYINKIILKSKTSYYF